MHYLQVFWHVRVSALHHDNFVFALSYQASPRPKLKTGWQGL